MPTTPVTNSADGSRITINSIIRMPMFVNARILRLADQQFVSTAVLRRAGDAPSGAVVYNESTPLFLDTSTSVVAEGAEIPVGLGSLGEEKVARSVKRAIGIRITEEMRRRNQVDKFNRNMVQVRNTHRRDWDSAFLDLLISNPNVQTLNANLPWSDPTSKVRFDILDATEAVTEATTGDQPNNYLGFEPNALLIGTADRSNLFKNDQFVKVYQNGGNLTSKNVRYTGKLENDVMGLAVLVSRDMPVGKAILCEMDTVGGISDERPLGASPLRHNDDNETWRSNVVRQSVMFVDQPKAAVVITTN